MKKQKVYEATDRLIDLIEDNYDMVQSLGRFGINLGFGDATVEQVCRDQNIDLYTFLTVINMAINGVDDAVKFDCLSIDTLLNYLRSSHNYFIEFQLPRIRQELKESLDETDRLAKLIMALFDEYADNITHHMKYEEKTIFPYLEKLREGNNTVECSVETFSKHHDNISERMDELKNIIIKYLPSDSYHNNQLSATLYDLSKNEEWIAQHAIVEDKILVPTIREIEKKRKRVDLSPAIVDMMSNTAKNGEAVSEREKEIIIGVVEGMENKQIAEKLCISVNTVITHRRNIARKLQIHSPAGLTVYAIVNKLVDISSLDPDKL